MSTIPGPNITFDGFGFNNANDEYKERLATLSKTFRSEKDRQKFGQYVETAVNCHAEMLEALEGLTGRASRYMDQSATHEGLYNTDMLARARAAIAKAKGAA